MFVSVFCAYCCWVKLIVKIKHLCCCHLPASKQSNEYISDTPSQLSEKETTPEPGDRDPSLTPKSQDSAVLLESTITVETSSVTLNKDVSESGSLVDPEVLTDPDTSESCSQLDEDTTVVSAKPEANNSQDSSDVPDNQLQDSSAITMTVAEAVTDSCNESLLDDCQPSSITNHEHTSASPDDARSQGRGKSQNVCHDSERECLVEQVKGVESCDSVPARTECVPMQPAKGTVVADQKLEEAAGDDDDPSGVGNYVSLPLIGCLAGKM